MTKENKFFQSGFFLFFKVVLKSALGSSMSYYFWDIASAVNIDSAGLYRPTAAVLDMSDIIQFLTTKNQVLFQGKSRDIQKLLKYFNGLTTFGFNLLLSASVLPIIFVL